MGWSCVVSNNITQCMEDATSKYIDPPSRLLLLPIQAPSFGYVSLTCIIIIRESMLWRLCFLWPCTSVVVAGRAVKDDEGGDSYVNDGLDTELKWMAACVDSWFWLGRINGLETWKRFAVAAHKKTRWRAQTESSVLDWYFGFNGILASIEPLFIGRGINCI